MRVRAQDTGFQGYQPKEVVVQQPKLAPYVAGMRACLAEDLGIGLDRVNVKATTTEGMGAIGRKEGMSASAVATVRLPL